ncbi:MAG: MATE family efflux transporter [Labilithrix sp.]|nr:MATE family efflux transporter [Labilithrix sp.]MBX3224013.1 MATE family efflux transporter [Labilithrix sp.]
MHETRGTDCGYGVGSVASTSPRGPLRLELATIAKLATPLALAQFGLTAIGLVDVAVLGHASAAELGGASIGRSINFASVAFGIGVAAAVEPLAAQAVGAGEEEDAWRAFLGALVGCLLVWLPTSALAVGATWLLVPIGIDPSLVGPARAFLVPQLPGMLAFTVFLATKSFLQAGGRATAPLAASVAANVVNFVVCNLLVRGDDSLVAVGLPPLGFPRLGAFGAGVASSISTFVLAAWVLVAAWRARPRGGRAIGPLRALPTRKVLRLGTPIGLQLLAEIGVFSLVAVLAGRVGTVAVAAHQIAMGLASFTFMGALGIAGATAVRVGHAIGEGRSPRRSGLVGIGLGAAFMSASALVFLVARRPLVAVFAEDSAVIELGADLLVIASAFQLFDGIQGVAAGALRGAGDVRFAFVANVGAHWLVGLPLALWLGFRVGLGAQGLWVGLLVGLTLVAALLLRRFVVVSKGPLGRV